MGCKIIKNGSADPDHAFLGDIFHRQGGTCYCKSMYHFEVSRFTLYEAINGSAKCRKWCGLGLDLAHKIGCHGNVP